MSEQSNPSLLLPQGLTALIDAGVWPRTEDEWGQQQAGHPLVAMKQVQRLAPDETLIIFEKPPFHTLAEEVAGNASHWHEFGALEQIDPELALIIADFGLGSDTVMVLDYRDNRSDPAVLRLRAHYDKQQGWQNAWVPCAETFSELIHLIGPLAPHYRPPTPAPKRRWFQFALPAMLMVTLACGLALLTEEIVNVRVRPAFQLDQLLSQEELADEAFRFRALELFDRAADGQSKAKRGLAIVLGVVNVGASLAGLIASYRFRKNT